MHLWSQHAKIHVDPNQVLVAAGRVIVENQAPLKVSGRLPQQPCCGLRYRGVCVIVLIV